MKMDAILDCQWCEFLQVIVVGPSNLFDRNQTGHSDFDKLKT